MLYSNGLSYILHQSPLDQMVVTGAADTYCIRITTPRTWSRFGVTELLSTLNVDLPALFVMMVDPCASLAVRMYAVPTKKYVILYITQMRQLGAV